MVAMLAVVTASLVVLSLPAFAAGHPTGMAPLPVVSLCLAGAMVTALPLALLRRGRPARAGLWVPVAAFVGLLVLEPFALHDPLPTGSTPWLVGLSLTAFSCTAVAEASPARAAVICAGLNAALACVFAEQSPASHSVVRVIALALLAAGLIAGVRIVRVRADRADAAEHDAQRLFENHQRQVATEAERVHTDGLLHDTVLAALLAAAGNQAPEQATSMSRSALELVSDLGDHPDPQPATVRFGQVLSCRQPELDLFHERVEVDLEDARTVRLPPNVAEALVSATLQALSNSVEHAGPSARRTAAATRLDDGGLSITIADDGAGFDIAEITEERLGVRVSILEHTRLAGASATIDSSPGRGTTVSLEWHPTDQAAPSNRRPGEALLNLIPRRHLSRVLGTVIVVAVLIANVEAFLVTHAYASVLASILGLTLLPALLRGARRGTVSNRVAWGTTVISCLLCCIATIGLDPATFDALSISRYTCGVLAGAVMGWMAGRRGLPMVAVAVLLAQITLWAGPAAIIRLGLAGEIVIVIAGLLMHHTLRRVTAAAQVAADQHRELTIRQAELDAFHLERQRRLRHASQAAAPMLHHIVLVRGRLDAHHRSECRVLEQALRDEIRGRHLLNDAVRSVVSAHRRRGSLVQILDDGGLDGLAPDTLDALLDDVVEHLEPVRSSRIVIRSGHPESGTAVTIVASTPDETAAALGIDADDEVDLWVTIPHPASVTAGSTSRASAA